MRLKQSILRGLRNVLCKRNQTRTISRTWNATPRFINLARLVAQAPDEDALERKCMKWGIIGGIAISTGIVGVRCLSTTRRTSAAEKYGDSPRFRFNFIADTVDKVAPSVVYIWSEEQRQSIFGPVGGARTGGSGFIVSSDGLIVTNAHVVSGKRRVNIQLADKRTFVGEVQGMDMETDLASVRIKASGLPYLKLGEVGSVRPGEWVIALGSPLSLNNTVTSGIVSNIQRTSQELGLPKKMEYIQTDAAIIQGNSGGPLVNLDGDVVGVNTMMITQGFSFAIPAIYVKHFLEHESKRARPDDRKYYLGVQIISLTPELVDGVRRRNPDFPNVDGGVLVARVNPWSPAHKHGILDGDIIVAVNGTKLSDAAELYGEVGKGQTLEILVIRGQHQHRFIIKPVPVS